MSARTRPVSLWRLVVLVGLLSVVQLQSAHATLNILWRYTVVSWDNPATEIEDQLACETAPSLDLAAEVRERVRMARTTAGLLATNPDDGQHSSPALSSGITRSPPTA